MLYERWRQIAREHAHELALHDFASGRRWTFSQLGATAESQTADEGAPIAFPEGAGAEFVLSVLRGWRARKVVCPLEPGQPGPRLAALPQGCAHLKTTSASTGAPRFVVFTAEQLAADAENIMATMGLRRGWPNLGAISLAHSYGFSNLVLPLLLHGVPLILAGSPLPDNVRLASAELNAITIPAVPALWRAWHSVGSIPPHVRLAISAGAPLPLSLEHDVFAATGIKIHDFYGSTECGGIAYDATQQPREDAACVGEPMRNVTLAVGVDGCLEVRSRAVGMSYWPYPDERLAAGCFRTTDFARIESGRVHLLGRAGDQINVAGRKVSPETIEQALRLHPAVRECVVFGVPSGSAERGEKIVACVSFAQEATDAELKQFLQTKLPAWQVPREWSSVESLEANERGKLPRAEWRAKFLAERSR